MEKIRAPRTYNPGDLIYQEEIFARVLERGKKEKKCEFCHKSSVHLIYCSQCTDVKYCNAECQRMDAGDHRMECGKLDKLRDEYLEDVIRLLARIIFKIKEKSWHDIRKDILGNSFSFYDIDSHYEEMTNNPRLSMLCSGLKAGLTEFIGEENLPTDDDLIKIIGKVKFSSLLLTTNLSTEFVFGVDKFEHECIPNSNIEVCDNFVKIWAIKMIEKSEKITISRIRMLTSNLIRYPLTEDSLSVCKCTECSLPYGESTFTKIIDKKKAYDAIRISEKTIMLSQYLAHMGLDDDFRLRLLIDRALEKQEGVLGPTNALHLKLLALKGMSLQETDIEKKKYILELGKNMSMALGDLYLEMRTIYESLAAVNYELGNFIETNYYLQKADTVNARSDEEQ